MQKLQTKAIFNQKFKRKLHPYLYYPEHNVNHQDRLQRSDQDDLEVGQGYCAQVCHHDRRPVAYLSCHERAGQVQCRHGEDRCPVQHRDCHPSVSLSLLSSIRGKADWDYSEKPHGGRGDSRTHFTTVLQDDKGNHIKTQHIPV